MTQGFDTPTGSTYDNPDRQTIPETWEANSGVDTAHGCTKAFSWGALGVQFADHDIGRMRDNGAQNTSQVTTSECNSSLAAFTVVVLGAREVVVHSLNDSFEGGELHHGIWDLATPQWVETFVETFTTSGRLIVMDC
jgi:hypothetical protein